jgi:hypothetical protein
MRTTRFVSGTFSPGTQSQKIGKPNNVEIFGSKKTKGSKQEQENQEETGVPRENHRPVTTRH